MNAVYLGKRTNVEVRIGKHGPFLDKKKNHPQCSFYEKIKHLYPGEVVLGIGFRFPNIIHTVGQLDDFERGILAMDKVQRPFDASLTNVEFASVMNYTPALRHYCTTDSI